MSINSADHRHSAALTSLSELRWPDGRGLQAMSTCKMWDDSRRVSRFLLARLTANVDNRSVSFIKWCCNVNGHFRYNAHLIITLILLGSQHEHYNEAACSELANVVVSD